jgi:hypothetical protein
MVTCLDDRMVNTHNGSAEPKVPQVNGNPPLPPTLAEAIASILESRDEQTELLWKLMANSTRGGNGTTNAPTPAPTTYSDFMEAGEPLEADHWLRAIKSKFGLLHCTEVEKALFAAQQLHGD